MDQQRKTPRGPTCMFEAPVNEFDDRSIAECNEAAMGIARAQLAAMDAAAVLAAKARMLRLDLAPLGVQVRDGGHIAIGRVTLSEMAEEELGLRILERIQRR